MISKRWQVVLFFCFWLGVALSPANGQTPSPELQTVVDEAVSAGLKKFDAVKSEQVAVSLLDLSEPDAIRAASYRGTNNFYPASVVKLFYLVAAQAQASSGNLTIDEEMGRALTDMIVD